MQSSYVRREMCDVPINEKTENILGRTAIAMSLPLCAVMMVKCSVMQCRVV